MADFPARTYQRLSSMEEWGGEYIYSTDSVNFEGQKGAKVTIDNSTTAEGFVGDTVTSPA